MKKQSLEALGAVEVEVLTEDNAPIVVHKGVYTLWKKPDGTLRIQYRREGSEEDDFMEMPGKLVALAQGASEGKVNPLDFLKTLMSMGMGG